MILREQLAKIEDVAAAAVPFDKIGAELGLTDSEWLKLVRENHAEIRLAIAKGRTEAEVRVNSALLECSRKGSVDASLFILQNWFDWKVTPQRRRRR
jgi:hypothetical protein